MIVVRYKETILEPSEFGWASVFMEHAAARRY